ncbi:NAD(P)/FAD-dependent oxidoreductase [Nocardioides sp. LHG3406-4]|uniref:NAD(P)/FAD-dependent oxidoreductase n=1 Tax=Nocardioides sp. LHG3406-4 TaxID=2804575 RepID=UPI003CF438CB
MTADQVWDVAVVGAGPAGATAALAALVRSPGARVLLLDRDDFPRDKSCGDGIAPHALDVLSRLGAHDVVEGWEPVRRLDLSRGSARVAGHLARPVWVVPRAVFDARLVRRAVDAGATLLRHRVRHLESTRHGVVIDGSITARVVIGADGARSIVRGAVGSRLRGPSAVAIRGYAPTPDVRRGLQVIRYGERRQPSYAWAFDRGDGQSNVGYGELAGSGDGLSKALMLDQLERLVPGAGESGTAWRAHHLPLSGWGRGAGQPDGPVLLVGDAAGLVNPMTGEGIYYAVATGAAAGRVAADAVSDGAPDRAGARHRAAAAALLGRHLKHTWAAARLSRSPRVVEAGIVASARDRRVFDDLVELGLGDGRLTPRLVAGLGRALLPARATKREG